MTPVSVVEARQIDAALLALEAVDRDAANLLRARMNACRFTDLVDCNAWIMRDAMLKIEEQAKSVAFHAHEVAMVCEGVWEIVEGGRE